MSDAMIANPTCGTDTTKAGTDVPALILEGAIANVARGFVPTRILWGAVSRSPRGALYIMVVPQRESCPAETQEAASQGLFRRGAGYRDHPDVGHKPTRRKSQPTSLPWYDPFVSFPLASP
jgi:hypothetical protein